MIEKNDRDYGLLTEDVVHYCSRGSFICFRMSDEDHFILNAKGSMPVIVCVCPICGEKE